MDYTFKELKGCVQFCTRPYFLKRTYVTYQAYGRIHTKKRTIQANSSVAIGVFYCTRSG